MTRPYRLAIVGGGLLGLATAYQALLRHPGLAVAVVEKEVRVAAHQSSHNSGVLHSGVYYPTGSLKARLCLAGKVAVEEFADRHSIPYERCGKVIVALRPEEFGRLAAIRDRAIGNGVSGIAELGPAGLRELEPHAAGLKALSIPGTAIIDFERVAVAYAGEVADRGGDLILGCRVTSIADRGGHKVLHTSCGEIEADGVLTCAGLYSDRFSQNGADRDDRIVPFRGDYYSLVPGARHLVRGLIYPVPDPALPFLGVHFTRRIDGEVWAGPNAVLALAREGYGRTTLDIGELFETLTFRGFQRLAVRHWRNGVAEMWRDLVKRAFVKDLQKYIPEISSRDLVFGPSGVRAQAVAADGRMVDDFSITTTPGLIQVRNAPSPGATASLAIGQYLAGLAFDAFDL